MSWWHALAAQLGLTASGSLSLRQKFGVKAHRQRINRGQSSRAATARLGNRRAAPVALAPQLHAALIEPLEQRRLLAVDFGQSADVNLISDVKLDAPVTVGSLAYFVHGSVAGGSELWKTDGSVAGTQLVFDPVSPVGEEEIRFLANVNGELYFSANHGGSGWNVWKSDGNSSGTTQVSSFVGLDSSHRPAPMINVGGTLYFTASATNTTARGLWRSDGTPAGTTQVVVSTGSFSYIGGLTEVSGRLFFAMSTISLGTELWTTTPSSGTAALVKDMLPGTSSGNPLALTNAGGSLIFSARDAGSNTEPWISDGTSSGTNMIRDIRPGGSSVPGDFAFVNGVTFFFANDGTNGSALWKTDGTCSGAVLVSDFRPDTAFYSFDTPGVVAGNRIVFFADDLSSVAGKELWVSDGTSAGTTLLKDIRPGPASSAIRPGLSNNGIHYFTANDGVHGVAVWRSDGTAGGTQMVADVDPGVAASVGSFGILNNLTLFRADGYLYAADGVSAGASRLTANRYLPSRSSDPLVLGGLDSGAVFGANDGTTGIEPWFSDGSLASALRIQDGTPSGSSLSSSSTGLRVGNRLYFTGSDRVWSTDGTNGGTFLEATVPVAVTGTAFAYSAPILLGAVGDTIILSAVTSATYTLTTIQHLPGPIYTFVSIYSTSSTLYSLHQGQLTSLGSTGNSVIQTNTVFDSSVVVGPPSLSATTYNGRVYVFYPNESDLSTDGTVAGTTSLSGIINVSEKTAVLFQGSTFSAALINGVSDGTELARYDYILGATRIRDIRPGSGASNPRRLTVVGDTLFFTANDGINGEELWKSDGTSTGTVLVQDIRVGAAGSGGYPLFNIGGRLVFYANDGTGIRLWSSDGTSSGVTPITPTTVTLSVQDGTATSADGRLYFVATDASHGTELWSTDGTSSGTAIFRDVLAGAGSSNPTGLTAATGRVWFAANDGLTGNELWSFQNSIPVANAGTAQSISAGSPLTLNAAASYHPLAGASIVEYSWDINGDGAFGDATGVNPTLPWSQLLALGVGAGTYNVRVRVTDNQLDSADSTAVSLTVVGGFVAAVGSNVHVYGTTGNDNFTFSRSGLPNKTNITVNGVNFGVWTVGSGGSALFDGFDGTDSVDLRGTTGGDTYDLSGTTVGINGLAHIGSSVENWTYTGNGGPDTFNVNAVSAGLILAGSGADIVNGPSGDHTWNIAGLGIGDLESTLLFRDVEALAGNAGNDRFNFASAGQISGNVNGGGGGDTLDYSASTAPVSVNLSTGAASRTGSVTNIENAIGGSANDTLIGDGNNNELTGNGGADTLLGLDGHDTLAGGNYFDVATDGADSLDGGAGNDNLAGGRGADTLRGDAGDDQLLGGSWTITDPDDGDFLYGDAGVDSLFGGAGHDVVYGGGENDLLLGGLWDTSLADGNDTLLGEGGDDVLLGGQGSDWLDGGTGVDWLFGGWWGAIAGDGDDILLGGAGDDFLFDMAGRDLLVGGMGTDTMLSGAGDDLLVSGELNFPAAQRDAAVAAIMAEWTGGGSYGSRVANLSGTPGGLNGGYYLTASTVQNDGALERLFGQADNDWFIVELLDITGDRTASETRSDL